MSIKAKPSAEAPIQTRDAAESVTSRYWRKFGTIIRSAELVGRAATAQIVFDKLRNDNSGRDLCIGSDRHGLKHPLYLGGRHDLGVYDEIFARQVYGLGNSYDCLINGQPIVDMGANIGLASAYFANRYPDSPVLSIEPLSRNFDLLRRNASPYAGQIDSLNAAVAAEPGIVAGYAMNEGRQNPINNMFGRQVHSQAMPQFEAAAVTPLDVLERLYRNGEQVGRILLKVDIEGAERDLFDTKDQIDPLLDATQVLLIETHDRFAAGSTQAVNSASNRNGLELTELLDGGHTLVYSRT